MADRRISQFVEMDAVGVDPAQDSIPVVDASAVGAAANKRMSLRTLQTLLGGTDASIENAIRAEAAAEKAEAFGRAYTETDEELASIPIPAVAEVIQRHPLSESPGQVAPAGDLTWWQRTTGPTAEPYFVTAGGVIWTQTGPRIREWVSAVNSAIVALATNPELFGAQPFASLAAFNAATIPASVNRASVVVGQVPGTNVVTVAFVKQSGAAVTGLKVGWVPDGAWTPEHFGAIKGTSAVAAANLTAIHAAVAALPINGTLTFGDGVYYTSGTVVVTRRIGLRGTGIGRCVIQCTSNTQSVIRFAPPNSATQFLDAPSLDGIGLIGGNGGTGATAGYALEIIRCNNGKFKSFRFSGAANGILLEGGQDVRISDFHGWGRFGGTMIAGSSLFEARTATWDGGVQKNYQCEVMDFRLSGHTSKVIEDIIHIRSADGLQFAGGYVNFGARSLLRWNLDDTNQGAGPVSFTNVYFDGVRNDSTGSDHFMSGATTAGASVKATFNGCPIGNFGQSIFDCPTDFGMSCLTFNACRFGWANEGLGTLTGNSAAVLIMDNCYVYRMQGGEGIFDTFDVVELGLTFGNSTATSLLELRGIIRQKSLRIMQQSSAAGAVNDVSTGVNRYASYEWQRSGTFTPELRIGGSATGITASTATGEYVTMGAMVWLRLTVTLSSKGSGTGDVTIAGLPFANTGGTTPVDARAFALPNNRPPIRGYIPNGSQSVFPQSFGINGDGPLTDADLNNNSTLQFSGTYRRR